MLFISELYIYPVKSLGGINIISSILTDRGFQYDRRWMLVDELGQFLSQRQIPSMALLNTGINEEGILVWNANKIQDKFLIPFHSDNKDTIAVQIWEDTCFAERVSKEADTWFSDQLKRKCTLVYMPDWSKRKVDKKYALNNEVTSFSDGYPLLMIGQASLDDLNSRLASPVPMDRFRPNIVFNGGYPFQEDAISQFSINEVDFYCVKPCGRCVITTIDQKTAQKDKEPLSTLAAYRSKNNKVLFGQNILYKGIGKIQVGDQLIIK